LLRFIVTIFRILDNDEMSYIFLTTLLIFESLDFRDLNFQI